MPSPPDAPISLIQTAFAAGEISPSLYGRPDLAKYKAGMAIMRNFFVDYHGGASSRPGTQYLGHPGASGLAHLVKFSFSSSIGQNYILVFSNLKLEFLKNPVTPAYPNSSNAGFVLTGGGTTYSIVTPYVEGDLRDLKFTQSADVMTITHPNYAPRQLNRHSDNNWTLDTIVIGAGIAAPGGLSATITGVPAGSTDPNNTNYRYCVTCVDAQGQESLASDAIGITGINLGTTFGSLSVFWSSVVDAVYYKVYKALPAPNGKLVSQAANFGFVGLVYGTQFVDNNVVPDFTNTPPQANNPFAPGQITSYTISATGAGYDPNITGPGVITDATGSGAVILPIVGGNVAGSTAGITGLFIRTPGSNYTAPTVAFPTGGGAGETVVLHLGPTTGLNPACSAYFQQRQIFAGSNDAPTKLYGSQPGLYNNFDQSNPVVASDSYEFQLAGQAVNRIKYMIPMPGGLVCFTDGGVLQLTGGSSSPSNPLAVTPSSAVIVPQSYFGCADLEPIVINYDILYVQPTAALVRKLTYNFFVNIYTGVDISILSNHLFYPYTLVDWDYQDAPFKIIWCVRSDGILLSLTYLPEQDILGWARHDTQGYVESVACVREGTTDALYLSVNRGGTRFLERLAGRVYTDIRDSWCLDCALSTAAIYPAANLVPAAVAGTNIAFVADANVFAIGDVGKVIRLGGGIATITAYDSAVQVRCTINQPFTTLPDGAGPPLLNNGRWTMNPKVTVISGLAHLNGKIVYALADGLVRGPFTVGSGTITLPAAASEVVVGLVYQCQLQTLPLDAGEPTIQGKRKRNAAVSVMLKDSFRGVSVGTTPTTVRKYVTGVTSTDPVELASVPGLFSGYNRQTLDASFNVMGQVMLQLDDPLPVTVLDIIPEASAGDRPE